MDSNLPQPQDARNTASSSWLFTRRDIASIKCFVQEEEDHDEYHTFQAEGHPKASPPRSSGRDDVIPKHGRDIRAEHKYGHPDANFPGDFVVEKQVLDERQADRLATREEKLHQGPKSVVAGECWNQGGGQGQ